MMPAVLNSKGDCRDSTGRVERGHRCDGLCTTWNHSVKGASSSVESMRGFIAQWLSYRRKFRTETSFPYKGAILWLNLRASPAPPVQSDHDTDSSSGQSPPTASRNLTTARNFVEVVSYLSFCNWLISQTCPEFLVTPSSLHLWYM